MENNSQQISFTSQKYGVFYVGQVVNRWKIEGAAFNIGTRKYVPATCTNCNAFYAQRRVDNLISGHSNGCEKCSRGLKKENKCSWQYKAEKDAAATNQNNLTGEHVGKRYGDLTIVKLLNTDKFGNTYYLCHCANCNNTEQFRIDSITYGHRTRCRKCQNGRSLGEQAVSAFLDKKGIDYKQQYTFEDLIGDVKQLRFDFGFQLNNKITLIEFQGKQHYEPIEYFGGDTQFAKQQDYDNKKREYCQQHGYELIEIPYTEINNLDKYIKV